MNMRPNESLNQILCIINSQKHTKTCNVMEVKECNFGEGLDMVVLSLVHVLHLDYVSFSW